jgi:hypothetical protein
VWRYREGDREVWKYRLGDRKIRGDTGREIGRYVEIQAGRL